MDENLMLLIFSGMVLAAFVLIVIFGGRGQSATPRDHVYSYTRPPRPAPLWETYPVVLARDEQGRAYWWKAEPGDRLPEGHSLILDERQAPSRQDTPAE